MGIHLLISHSWHGCMAAGLGGCKLWAPSWGCNRVIWVQVQRGLALVHQTTASPHQNVILLPEFRCSPA
jgi:hypothetical protein